MRVASYSCVSEDGACYLHRASDANINNRSVRPSTHSAEGEDLSRDCDGDGLGDVAARTKGWCSKLQPRNMGELKALCRDNHCTGYGSLKKDEMVRHLAAHLASKEMVLQRQVLQHPAVSHSCCNIP
jgi:hypothetical protein